MLLVKSFDLFRKTKSGKIWTYKEEKEYTAPCKLEPVALDVEVGLDNAPALDAWRMYTDTLDIDIEDKVVIDSVEYIVNSTKKYYGLVKNNCISLIKKKYD